MNKTILLDKKLSRRDFIYGLLSCSAGLFLFPKRVFASAAVNSLRLGSQPNGLRLVLDLTEEVNYRVFLLSNPKRAVIDVKDCLIMGDLPKSGTNDNSEIIAKIRKGATTPEYSRLVLDLSQNLIVKKVFYLPPQSGFNWRLVIDFIKTDDETFINSCGINNSITKNKTIAFAKDINQNAQINTQSISIKKPVIVLDPGHGGKDPGAIGYSGEYEKNITLKAAKSLKKALEATGKYKVYLTRESDETLSLRERIARAHKYKGNLFISMHADANCKRSTKGASVYTLSEKASDKEAAALAEKENKADIIAGVDLSASPEVADVLIDLLQRETLNSSAIFAGIMLDKMTKQNICLLRNTHRFAGFTVLKSPEIPSVLLEMGHLSNKQEEELLKQNWYRMKIANAGLEAINSYFAKINTALL